MAGRMNKIWDAIQGNKNAIWGSYTASDFTSLRAWYSRGNLASKANKANRPIVSYATRALAGSIVGAGVGAAWGAVSDKESIVSGAMKGAFVGGAARVALRGFNPKFSRGMAKFTQSRNIRANLATAWSAMSATKNVKMRNFALAGMGLGAARGMVSGDDNPIGGAIGGGIAGGIQGAGAYAGYRGIKKFGFKY